MATIGGIGEGRFGQRLPPSNRFNARNKTFTTFGQQRLANQGALDVARLNSGGGQSSFGISGIDPRAGDFLRFFLDTAGGLERPGLTEQQQATSQQQQEFLANPAASPLFKGQLAGLLQSLSRSEGDATQNLEDMFRRAGGVSSSAGGSPSGAFGTAASRLQGDILGRRQELASGLLNKTLSTTLQGFGQQFGFQEPERTAGLQQLSSLSQALGAIPRTSVSTSQPVQRNRSPGPGFRRA